MIRRNIETALLQALADTPVVFLNGARQTGKSTLAHVIAGRPGYDVTAGEIVYEGRNLLDLSPEERAREGILLAFQYPVEIPGVSNSYFLRAALNAIRKERGASEIDAFEFLGLVREKLKVVQMDESFLNRSIKAGLKLAAFWSSSIDSMFSRVLVNNYPLWADSVHCQ